MALTFTHAIVVGGSSGIGAAMATQLARGGTKVAILARRADELERIKQTSPDNIKCYVHDVENHAEVPALLERIERDLGGLDLLVYAAGILKFTREGEYNFEKERATIAVNVIGAMAWMNPIAAKFEAVRRGSIVGISSIAGERGRRNTPAYGTSKAALTTYLEALRNRCTRYGVNIVTIKPGYVETDMIRGAKNLFWVITADEAAKRSLRLAAKGGSASGYVPRRWALVGMAMKCVPSVIFRRLNF
ncbi:MAG: SDR family NAD(P)-dependent oxidoreductase [Myxococcales bacterium]|nr:SDR family NAD(P)-dependent oxidoreductase [Myxococcales bacterium]